MVVVGFYVSVGSSPGLSSRRAGLPAVHSHSVYPQLSLTLLSSSLLTIQLSCLTSLPSCHLSPHSLPPILSLSPPLFFSFFFSFLAIPSSFFLLSSSFSFLSYYPALSLSSSPSSASSSLTELPFSFFLPPENFLKPSSCSFPILFFLSVLSPLPSAALSLFLLPPHLTSLFCLSRSSCFLPLPLLLSSSTFFLSLLRQIYLSLSNPVPLPSFHQHLSSPFPRRTLLPFSYFSSTFFPSHSTFFLPFHFSFSLLNLFPVFSSLFPPLYPSRPSLLFLFSCRTICCRWMGGRRWTGGLVEVDWWTGGLAVR